MLNSFKIAKIAMYIVCVSNYQIFFLGVIQPKLLTQSVTFGEINTGELEYCI